MNNEFGENVEASNHSVIEVLTRHVPELSAKTTKKSVGSSGEGSKFAYLKYV